ncbi:hypothetical protein FOZ63_027588, partial [Perkinsus olseni]
SANEVKWNSLYTMIKSVLDAWEVLNSILIEKGKARDKTEMICHAREKIRDGFQTKVISRLTLDCLLPSLLHPKLRLEGVSCLSIVQEFRKPPACKASTKNLGAGARDRSLDDIKLIQQLNEWAIVANTVPPCHGTGPSNEQFCSSSSPSMPAEIIEIPGSDDEVYEEDSCIGNLLGEEKLPRYSLMDGEVEDQLHERVESEVKRYLSLPRHDESYNSFWHKAKVQFPLLSKVALCAKHHCLTTASCESLFSRARDHLGLRRTELKTATLESLLVRQTTDELLGD